MELKINVVDAFTDVTFKGNSAAVIITDNWLCVELMQSIAIENNLSETAFVKKIDHQHYEIRWFSPITEIDFCGHATLAASFVIFANHHAENKSVKTINFFAKAVGDLSVTQADDGMIQMSFPNRCPALVNDIPAALLNGLSIKPKQVLRNEQAYFAVYDQVSDVLDVRQDKELIKQLAPYDVVVTASANLASNSDLASYPRLVNCDFISRYFWPANGGDEDPVTGSIHTGLAPYWASKLNKTELLAYQASKRGGLLMCRLDGDKVHISGKAVQYLQGTININELG